MSLDTLQQYQSVLEQCALIFANKTTDYGTSWRVYRTISIADQIYIKAWRIRQIQEKGQQKISDSIESEFMAMVNYGIMALIQLAIPADAPLHLTVNQAQEYYRKQAKVAEDLMLKKNHDYGEAWRNLSQASFVDLILTKVLRIRQIVANDGKTLISEGVDANFLDIINYSVFALILIKESGQKQTEQ